MLSKVHDVLLLLTFLVGIPAILVGIGLLWTHPGPAAYWWLFSGIASCGYFIVGTVSVSPAYSSIDWDVWGELAEHKKT